MSKQENVTFDRDCQSEGLAPLNKQCLSRELKDLLNVAEDVKMTRGQVVRRVWNYIDEHQLKDPVNKRYIIPDEKMSTVFGKEKFLGFAMAKYLEKHYKRENINDNARERTSFGNKIRQFFEGGCTRNEYIGFGVTFGILVTAVLVAGMAVAYGNGLNRPFGITGFNLQDFDTEAFDKAYIDLEKFGNYVEKAEGFDRADEEFEEFGQIVEEKIDVTEENIKEGLVHAGEELEKFGQNIEEKMDEAEAKIKEGLFHAGEELEKLGQNIQEKFEKFD